MRLNQWFTLADFHSHTLPEKLELLLTQRETLFQQQHELLQQRTALARQMRELVERQTAHELQSHLFWLRLRQAACPEQKEKDETETIPASEYSFALPEFTLRLLSGDTRPQMAPLRGSLG